MTRVALYARYSSDRQNERSIADQFTVCRRHAEARGWTVVMTFEDAAISGAAMANRPGILNMIQAAEAGLFDLLLVEDEDRLARNDEHNAFIFNLLKFLEIGLATLTSDRVTKVESSIKGLLAQMTLDAISSKTKRGMRANAEAGKATGSRLYGYRTEAGGGMTIVEDEAETIRRIFAGFAGGITVRDIAARLNAEGVPGPRGGPWNASTINGSRSRANGILHTELYNGVKVWNRMDVRKDPRTGNRLPRMKPREEWKRTPVPHLAIIGDDVWAQVQARLDKASANAATHVQRRPHLFSGLFKCGCCGSSYTVYNGDRLSCAGFREKGPAFCSNKRLVNRPEIEQRVLAGFQDRLLSPEAVSAYVRLYHEAWQRQVAQDRSARLPLQKRHAELSRQIDRIIDAVCAGTATGAMTQRLQGIENERDALAAQLAEMDDRKGQGAPVQLHPNSGNAYAARVARLRDAIAGGEIDQAATEAIRDLVTRIAITPESQEKGAPVQVTLEGDLARFMLPETSAATVNPSRVRVVAGASYMQNPTSVPVKIAV